jgi:hypothetical protein
MVSIRIPTSLSSTYVRVVQTATSIYIDGDSVPLKSAGGMIVTLTAMETR